MPDMNATRLIAFARAPGLSTIGRTQEVKDFLLEFKDMLAVDRAAYGEPTGLSVESHLDTVEWYISHKTDKN
jgi:hypothetical protein